MTLLKGIPVTLLTADSSGQQSARTWTPETVENVLVAPYAETDGTRALQPSGHQAVYHMAIPKGDTHRWEGALVQFFGCTWAVVGLPVRGIDELIPGPWNAKVLVELYRTEAPSPAGLWSGTVTLLDSETVQDAAGYRRQTADGGRDVAAIFTRGVDYAAHAENDKSGARRSATAEVWEEDYRGESRLRYNGGLYNVTSARNTGRGTRMLELEEVWR